MQINAWNDFITSQQHLHEDESSSTLSTSHHHPLHQQHNDLADWLIENKIVEYLFGPNLHVEVIKQSQEIVNFLAFSNRLRESHLDVIWSAAQVKKIKT
jgi:hypothetical protein